MSAKTLSKHERSMRSVSHESKRLDLPVILILSKPILPRSYISFALVANLSRCCTLDYQIQAVSDLSHQRLATFHGFLAATPTQFPSFQILVTPPPRDIQSLSSCVLYLVYRLAFVSPIPQMWRRWKTRMEIPLPSWNPSSALILVHPRLISGRRTGWFRGSDSSAIRGDIGVGPSTCWVWFICWFGRFPLMLMLFMIWMSPILH